MRIIIDIFPLHPTEPAMFRGSFDNEFEATRYELEWKLRGHCRIERRMV